MKILIVSQYFWPEQFIINDLAVQIQKQGHEVSVYTGKPNYPDGNIFPGYQDKGVTEEMYADSIPVFRVPLRPRKKGGGINLALNYLSFVLSGLRHARKFSKNKEFDVIFAFGVSPITSVIPAIYIKWLTKSHLTVWVQDLWPESVEATGFIRNSFMLRCISSMVRSIYYCSDSILTQSKAFIPFVSRLASADKISYYPNTVVDDFAAPQGHEQIPNELTQLLDSTFCVVFAGNIGIAQSVETIVGAAEQLKDVPGLNLVMIGSGSKSEWVAEQIQEKQLTNLILPGRFPSSLMPAIFSKASALLVTLKKDQIFSYTVPCKVQSYLAAAKPIIACLDGEGARVVDEAGAGITCPAEDVSSMAQSILKLFQMSEEERLNMGSNGREYYLAHYEMSSQVDELLRTFEHQISTKRAFA